MNPKQHLTELSEMINAMISNEASGNAPGKIITRAAYAASDVQDHPAEAFAGAFEAIGAASPEAQQFFYCAMLTGLISILQS